MSFLPLMFVPLFAMYVVLSVIVFRQASKPSCRVCALRHFCPSRLRGRDQFTELPACARQERSTAGTIGAAF